MAQDPCDARYESGLADAILSQRRYGTIPPEEGMARLKAVRRGAPQARRQLPGRRRTPRWGLFAISTLFAGLDWKTAEEHVQHGSSSTRILHRAPVRFRHFVTSREINLAIEQDRLADGSRSALLIVKLERDRHVLLAGGP